jgi:hypothetical protein
MFNNEQEVLAIEIIRWLFKTVKSNADIAYDVVEVENVFINITINNALF